MITYIKYKGITFSDDPVSEFMAECLVDCRQAVLEWAGVNNNLTMTFSGVAFYEHGMPQFLDCYCICTQHNGQIIARYTDDMQMIMELDKNVIRKL